MSSRAVRVGVAEAKARMAAIIRAAPRQRTIIQRRGKDAAVVIGIEELRRLEAAGAGATAGARVLHRVAAWRERTGGFEVDETTFPRAEIVAHDPFAPEPRRARK